MGTRRTGRLSVVEIRICNSLSAEVFVIILDEGASLPDIYHRREGGLQGWGSNRNTSYPSSPDLSQVVELTKDL